MSEEHLRIYNNRSEYIHNDGRREIFQEGAQSSAAAQRASDIIDALRSGYLIKLISNLKAGTEKCNFSVIPYEIISNLKEMTESLTSEAGRALIGLTFLQLTIKSLSPYQSIRLHKGGHLSSGFSWTEGISMRTIDKGYITPILRKFNLLSLNSDGIMMTRSLAENYPYSSLYKAQLRGAKKQWISIVEFLESKIFPFEEALKLLILLLLDKAEAFTQLAQETIVILKEKMTNIRTINDVIEIMEKHRDNSDYAARLLEISMHALAQAAIESNSIILSLNPLSQMRSANKKHGNIGDIEFLEGNCIVESWDAKYGKTYLREELEELNEKLISYHYPISKAGFVTSESPLMNHEILKRMYEIEENTNTRIVITDFRKWVSYIFERCHISKRITEEQLAQKWILSYTLSIAQRKRDIAPIDEPCSAWLQLLKDILNNMH